MLWTRLAARAAKVAAPVMANTTRGERLRQVMGATSAARRSRASTASGAVRGNQEAHGQQQEGDGAVDQCRVAVHPCPGAPAYSHTETVAKDRSRASSPSAILPSPPGTTPTRHSHRRRLDARRRPGRQISPRGDDSGPPSPSQLVP